MTTAADLEALAQRVEREEPSRELQTAVLRAFGWELVAITLDRRSYWRTPIAGRFVQDLPDPLHSLDAAASLVPSGAVWLRKSEKVMTVAFYGRGEEDWGIHIAATGPNPAAALTAAALRAMAREMADNE